MNSFEIFRPPSTSIAVIPADKNTTFSKISSEHATVVFYSNSLITIQLWDYIVFSKVNYYLNGFPGIQKISSNNYKYTCDLSTIRTHAKGWLNH